MQEHYTNPQRDPLDNPLTICPIQRGSEVSVEPSPNWLIRSIEDMDWVFGECLVATRTRTPTGGSDLLLIIIAMHLTIIGDWINHERSQYEAIDW